MAADYRRMVADLLAFYDFKGKTVLWVGAGGGQLAEWVRVAGPVQALDCDPRSLETLRQSLRSAGLEDKVSLILGDFYAIDLKADIILFEFCLHEMADPGAALERARSMAPAVVIFDHWPGSDWSYIAGEEAKVAASWAALRRIPVIKTQSYETVQVFGDYGQLHEKVKGQGEPSLSRIAAFEGKTDIRIPMSYGLALIGR